MIFKKLLSKKWCKYILNEQGQSPEEKFRRWRRRIESEKKDKYKTLYHIAMAPVQPEIRSEVPWIRPQLKEPQKESALFLTPDWRAVALEHGKIGNVYKYEIPYKLLEELRKTYYKQPGKQPMHRFDRATEILIPGDLWEKYKSEIKGPDLIMHTGELEDWIEQRVEPLGQTWADRPARRRRHNVDALLKNWENITEESIKLLGHGDRKELYMGLQEKEKELKKNVDTLRTSVEKARKEFNINQEFNLRNFLEQDQRNLQKVYNVLSLLGNHLN